jgi:hypothetical protein
MLSKIINFLLWPVWFMFNLIRGTVVILLTLFILIKSDVLVKPIKNIFSPIATEIYKSRGFRTDLSSERYKEYVQIYKDRLNVKYIFNNLENIPTSGKLVVITNHPGALENEVVCDTINTIRNNQNAAIHLTQIPRCGAFSFKGKTLASEERMRINKYISGENALVISPAGRLEQYFYFNKPHNKYKQGFLKFAMDNEADIMPVYIHFSAPWWLKLIYLISQETGLAIHLCLRELLLENKTVEVTFGKVIPYEEIKKDKDKTFIKYGKPRYSQDVLDKYQEKVSQVWFGEDYKLT